FATNGPSLVEATVDPFEPPMPAQATIQQGIKLAESLVRGQPHAGKIATTIFRDKLHELL
ncbi:pyruvate oxidase, partial [Singulisphaera rosea]